MGKDVMRKRDQWDLGYLQRYPGDNPALPSKARWNNQTAFCMLEIQQTEKTGWRKEFLTVIFKHGAHNADRARFSLLISYFKCG